jgi:hypothetical protein
MKKTIAHLCGIAIGTGLGILISREFPDWGHKLASFYDVDKTRD